MKRSSVSFSCVLCPLNPWAFDTDTEIGVSVAAKGRSSGDRTAATANRTSTPVWRLSCSRLWSSRPTVSFSDKPTAQFALDLPRSTDLPIVVETEQISNRGNLPLKSRAEIYDGSGGGL
jgi:hypothetical protein